MKAASLLFPFTLLLVLAGLSATAGELPPLVDHITKRIEWRDPSGEPLPLVPYHVNLLPDGRVMLFDPAFIMEPTPYWLALDADLPDFVTIAENTPPLVLPAPGVDFGEFNVRDEVNCSGHGLTKTGKLVTFGGTRYVAIGPADDWSDCHGILGLADSLEFDPAARPGVASAT